MLQECASSVAALDMGFVPGPGSAARDPSFVYLLGADDYNDSAVPEDAFVVYQGHHGDKGAARANVILPGAAYTEKAGTYVNFEGRVQQTRAAISTPGDAREDWKIIRALSEIVGSRLPCDSLEKVQERLEMVSPTFATFRLNRLHTGVFWLNGEYSKTLGGKVGAEPLTTSVKLHYMSDAISRASPTMARVVRARQESGLNA
jgi:NADH dehydrogenase (ubiquinone) Fe-S protein 1